MFRVVWPFADSMDNGYIYKAGDKYPRTGVQVSEERLGELASSRNSHGSPLIEADSPREGSSEVKEDTEGAQAGVNPSEAVRAKKRPRKGQEKNARADS